MPSNFFPPYAIEPNLFTPLCKHRRQYSQRKNVISATKKDITLQHNFKPTNNQQQPPQQIFSIFSFSKNISCSTQHNTTTTHLSKKDTSFHFIPFHSLIHFQCIIHSFILRHSQSTYIFLLINNILLSNSIHSSIKQPTNISTTKSTNSSIHPIHPIHPIQQPIFRLFNSFFNNILCLF